MFFDDWSGLFRIIIVGFMAYASLVVLLRISGKRTLSKFNAFDLVVTVALGSTLATVLLDKSVPLAEGVVALTLLVTCQFAITWLSVRSSWFSKLIKSEPTTLVEHGQYASAALHAQRVTKEEVLAALRSSGIENASQVAVVVLETDGSISVVPLHERIPKAP